MSPPPFPAVSAAAAGIPSRPESVKVPGLGHVASTHGIDAARALDDDMARHADAYNRVSLPTAGGRSSRS